ncbi:heavy metal translocating P-type ATPase [Thiothrix nivea]|uniref:P-type Zn(2+) transporter n=1 Tax=Thiothrix nivea (strain ATCC 35100 / DSM 5205 / JP2) TaxID=870187 RepID=A0A656HDQ6_THINJ|nr:heavy metal translocating P-type ATPase [Thiothrix nivea]EIJ33570.1 heavy metal translocating P-type ATPase [Thiothrix nivea DSM 5205]
MGNPVVLPVVLHETPARLRVRLPAVAERGFNPVWLESWLEAQAGVRDVHINRKAASVAVDFDPQRTGRDAILQRLGSFRREQVAATAGEATELGSEFAPMLSSAATLALMPLLSPPQRRLLSLANAAPILLNGVDTFINEGVKMEVLDALAIGLAGFKGEAYSASITTFLLALGEFLEHQTERKSDKLLRRLLQPEPAPAWVERDGELVQVPGDEVQVGEIVVVGIGETVPVDGRVVEGVALLNQAAVTGEDLPVRKEQRHRVVAGSVVEEGRIRIEAQRVGSDTTTARVASFIQSSLANRSDTQRMADELADKRVWFTLLTGGLVYALTRDLTRLQSVFLVDYSCALKLGTPMAFKSGMYRAATHGILMRGGSAIEHLAEVDTIVFDKTGTLTHSELVVTDVVVLDKSHLDEDALLALVASIEEHASHPLAQAVVDAAKERDLQHITHGEIDYLVAHGLSTDVDGKRVVIGSRHFLEEHHHILFAKHETAIDRLQDEGKTLLYIGAAAQGRKTAKPIGIVALRDTLRADAVYAINRLRSLGITQAVMITGDKRSKAEALAAELGLDAVHAEVAPEEKAAIIQQLQAQGHKVAFVGDGINDGPALSVAEVGIAMPRGADIARATADIVLMDDRLAAVADARELAGRTMQLIRSNFNIAVGVNTAVLAGAVLGRLSPVMSAVLHNGTTIGVLLRALVGVDIEGLADGKQVKRR